MPRRVVGDAERLRQVLVNLVGNAVKFTERGDVVVRVRASDATAPAATAGAALDIGVADTGIGIAADKQALVFDAFTQADGSTTPALRRHRPRPVDLRRAWSQMMGGELSVESAPGEGSTFRARLPLESPRTRAGAGCRRGWPASARWSSRRRAAAARITAAMLADWGAEVVTAADQDGALTALDGRAVPARRPRRARARPNRRPTVSAALAVQWPGLVSVVLVTSDRPPEELDALRAGGTPLTTKPLRRPSSPRRSPRRCRTGRGWPAPLVEPGAPSATARAAPRASRPAPRCASSSPRTTRSTSASRSAMLSKRGHTVHVVDNGRQACEARRSPSASTWC